MEVERYRVFVGEFRQGRDNLVAKHPGEHGLVAGAVVGDSLNQNLDVGSCRRKRMCHGLP